MVTQEGKQMTAEEEFGHYLLQMKNDVHELMIMCKEFAEKCRELRSLVNAQDGEATETNCAQ